MRPVTTERNKDYGRALRILRWPSTTTKARMTQGDLAKELGVSHTLICKWEQGRAGYRPSEEHLKKLCKVFHIKRKDLDDLAEQGAGK